MTLTYTLGAVVLAFCGSALWAHVYGYQRAATRLASAGLVVLFVLACL